MPKTGDIVQNSVVASRLQKLSMETREMESWSLGSSGKSCDVGGGEIFKYQLESTHLWGTSKWTEDPHLLIGLCPWHFYL
jgi:hypothetical protein